MKKTNMIKLLGTGVIMLSMVTGCGNGQSAQKYTSLVTLDVNPSIQLHLDEDDKVIEAIAVNDDAKKVLQDMELEQADANVAMNAVLGSLVKNGYLNANQNTVLLSVENDDDQARVALEDELSQYIYTTLKGYSIEGAIYSQDIDIDDDVESLMNKYSISYGKANLIEDIIDENDDAKKTYKVEDLVKLNAQDLILIYQSLDKDDTQKKANKMVGNVSTKQYITKDEALNIALKNASVSKSQIKELEIDYDMENGVLTYDIEFKYNQNEYEYEVSAEKGIVEREVEPEVKPVSKPSNTQQTTQNKVTNQNNTNYDNTNYDNTNYNSTSKPAASKPSTSSQTSKNTNYDNTNYDNTNYDNTNYDNTNYDDNTNYQSTNKPATSKPSTQPSSSGQSTNKNTNYDNTNYDNTNYDDHDDDTNYDNDDDHDDTNYDDD